MATPHDVARSHLPTLTMSKGYFDLHGTTAVVTGAGQGLGLAVARRLASAGALVGINDTDIDNCHRAVLAIEAQGGQAFALPGDVAQEQQVARMFDQVHTEFGGVDILVNNAGIVRAQNIFEMDIGSWRAVMDVNLLGAVLCSRSALMQMRAHARGGRIIMMASMVAHQGAVQGWVHYAASKSALLGLAKTLARTGAEFAVTVNAVAPGIVETDMLMTSHGPQGVRNLQAQVPLARLGQPADVAAAVHFLASRDAGYITGATIDVNGGMYMRA